MSNPVSTKLPLNTWTKIATNVITGSFKKISNMPTKYLETYRLTGQAAPTDRTEGAVIFLPGSGDEQPISSVDPVDVYVMAVGNAGEVRADLPS